MASFSKPASIMPMLFALLSLLHFTLAFQHGHHARAHGDVFKSTVQEVEDYINKRQSSTDRRFAIVGACSTGYASNGKCNPGSGAAPRLELRELAENTDAYNLFLLGMERFKAMDKSDALSYYAIAGIHGRPNVSWGGFPRPLVNNAGFCPHAMTLFASWHRVYVTLFEQGWYRCVLEVVEEFPASTRQHWRDIAVQLRLPTWDWARFPGDNRPSVPTLLRDRTMPVRKPTGDTVIANPIYSYLFGSSVPSEIGGTPWNSFPETLRRPVGNPTRSNNNEMNARFDTMRTSLRDRVFGLFASKAPLGSATTAAIGVRTDMSGSGVDSFEAIHDVVHNLSGGESGGFMYYLDIAAFDPAFWFHHSNMDRLTHMYQFVVPNTWIANGNVARPMAQWNQGEAKNMYSPLKPFTKDTAGNYFSSVDIIETRTLGYYYPETSDRSYQQTVRAINQLYSANGRSLSKRDGGYTSTGQYLGRPIKEGEYHTVLSVIANKYAISGSYTIHCFVGKPDNSTSKSTSNSTAPYPMHNSTLLASISVGGLNISASIGSASVGYGSYTSDVMSDPDDAPYDPSTDPTQDSNYVGSFGVLGGMMAGGGNASQPVMTKGSVPLTTCLQGKVASGELQSLTPEHIEPYLQKNLYYKVITKDGEVDAGSIADLHISVACTKAKPAASDDELPDLSAPYQVLPKATAHLPAGQPFTYVPSALDIPLPEGQAYDQPSSDGTTPNPSHGVFPKPATMPWDESGYCYSQQTIEYVDEGGNFLYSQMGSGGK